MPHTEYYDILEISHTSSIEEVKKAYKKKAIKHHPDKGGDKETFQKITEAYEVLSDPEKKNTYDKFGKDGLNPSSQQGGFPDIFAQMFGGGHPFFGGGSAQQSRVTRTPDINHILKLSLHDIYFGKSVKLKLKRKILCKDCVVKLASCNVCHGKKIVMITQQMGNMRMQQTINCPECKGIGKKKPANVSKENECNLCQGNILIESEKLIEFDIPRGIGNGEIIKFEKCSNEDLDCETGDLNIRIQEIPDKVFERSGKDLHMTADIPLLDALVGGDIQINHVDEKKSVKLNFKGVVNYGETKEFEGMGIINHSGCGKLFIKFNVVFPKEIDKDKIKYIKKGLS